MEGKTKVGRQQRWAEMEASVQDMLAPDIERLRHLRKAASHFFCSTTKHTRLPRRPSIKVTIPFSSPEITADVTRLVIRPYSYEGRVFGEREWEFTDDVLLNLMHGTIKDGGLELKSRIEIMLFCANEVKVHSCYMATVRDDARHASQAAMRFLDDPAAVIAESGTHCAYCGRPLTDPDSRSRGIGPECFARNGDFLRWLKSAPDAAPHN